MKRILTALSFILISYASFGQGGKYPITVSGSGGGGGTTGGRYTTNDFGTLVDSATTNVYKIIVDTTVIASQARLSTMLALKLNIADTSSMLSGYQTAINKNTDSITAHNTRIGKNTDSLISHNTRIGAVTVSDALKWSTTGTVATAGSSYLGTSNNVSLLFNTNGTNRGKADSLGNFIWNRLVMSVGQTTINPVNQRSLQYASDGSYPHAFVLSTSDSVGCVSCTTNANGAAGMLLADYSASAGNVFIHAYKARGNSTTPTGVHANDVLFGLSGNGYLNDTASFGYSGPGFHMYASEAWSKTAMGSYWDLFNTQTGTLTRRINLRLENTGRVTFNYGGDFAPGTLADQKRAISVTATMPSGTATAYNSAQDMQITSVSNTQNQYAFNMDLLSGGTDAKIYAGGRFHSGVAGTGANLLGVVGNYGTLSFVDATTTGYNVAAYNWANGGGALAVGSVNMSRATNNSKRNIGAVAIANNAGTGAAATGLYVGMNTTDPTFADGALVVDNSSVATPIALFRDNGTVIATIADGGAMRIGDATSPTDKLEVTGNFALTTAGNKLKIATGSNASIGVSGAMTAGSITISTTAVTASSKIFLTIASVGGTPGVLSVGTITAGTSFVINSSSGTDTSTVNWWIVN